MADFSFDAGSNSVVTSGEVDSGGTSGLAGSGGAGVAPGSGGSEAGGGGSPAGGGGSTADASIPTKRRRGRPALSEAERAARASARASASPGTGSGPSASPANASGKEGLDLKPFKKNDRTKVGQNIAGIHMMAAVLTKQPIMMLSDVEAKALTNSLCDVADYHEISLDGAGGAFGLYAALATTVYGIYVPRIVALKSIRQGDTIVGVAPTTPGDAKAAAQQSQGGYDFSGDIASTVQ